MTVQLSVATRTARVQAIETEAGTTPVLKVRTGAQPANCATADSGTVLASITLASDWASTASGVLTFSNAPFSDASADATGTAAHYRLYKSDGTTCVAQGSVGQGSGDLSVDNTSFVAGQTFSVTAWTITDGNA
mgnify:CR=1 FL=1